MMRKMKKARYLDEEERELAQSLEKEEWIPDLTKKEKSTMRNMPAIALTNKGVSTYE
jgi:hypothetical protein